MDGSKDRGAGWGEDERLAALLRYDILDTPPEDAFADIVSMAARICDAPMAAISLVDRARQWFKAEVGLNVSETPRDISFCAHAIEFRELMVVPDATRDPRFVDNPLVTGEAHIRFYAGAVLSTPEGLALGALCVIDREARPQGLTPDQAMMLKALARQVISQLELRRALALQAEANARLRSLNAALAESEERAGASEARLQAILDSSTDYAIITSDNTGRIASWNPGAEKVLQWSGDEVVGQNLALIFTPEDRAKGTPAAELITADAAGHALDERWHLRKDGSRFWAIGTLTPLISGDGSHLGYLKILRDRTGQRITEQNLRAAEERLRFAVQAGLVGWWDWDLTDGLVYADAHFAGLFGLDPVRAGEGAHMAEVMEGVHPGDRDWVSQSIRRSADEMADFAEEYRLLKPSGEIAWVFTRGRCYRDEDGRIRFPGVAIDITARKLAEEALRDADVGRELALQAGRLGRWDHHPATGRRFYDTRAKEILGLGPDDDIAFDKMLALIHPEDQEAHLEALAKVLDESRTGPLISTSRITRPNDGAVRWVSSMGRSFFENGRCIRFVGVLEDVTERVQAQERQRLLTNELNHRVKNTLAMVQALVSQTLRSVRSPEEARKAVTERLIVLGRAHDVLTRTSWAGAPICEVVQGATAALAAEPGRIRIHGPPIDLGPKPALSLTLALHELGANAVKYGALSGDAGRVELTWTIDPAEPGSRFRLRWSEHDGPLVTKPTRRGFGSRLIETAVAADFSGTVKLDFSPEGVSWTLDAPLEAMQKA